MADLLNATEEDYNSASDEDFTPDNTALAVAADNNEESSSSENENDVARQPRSGKRKAIAEDVGFDNSGDEATIKKVRRKKQSNAQDDEDEGGEGGLIKTRAQRRAEVQEKKPLVNAANSSVDVDALWAQMANTKKETEVTKKENGSSTTVLPLSDTQGQALGPSRNDFPTNITSEPSASGQKTITSTSFPPPSTTDNGSMITMKRTYQFAGETMTEERTVPASSAEARLYLEEQARKASTTNSVPVNPKPGLRRPKKRTSMFAPGGIEASSGESTTTGKKLTTLEKSKLDWAQHVDQEGISEELDEHRRAKGGYLGRMDFLGRMDMKKEEELQKLKPK